MDIDKEVEVDVVKKTTLEEPELLAHDSEHKESEHEEIAPEAHDSEHDEVSHDDEDLKGDDSSSDTGLDEEILEAVAEEAEDPTFYQYVVLSTLLGNHGRGAILTEHELGFENMIRLVNNGSIAHVHTDSARVALLERSISDAAVTRAQEKGN